MNIETFIEQARHYLQESIVSTPEHARFLFDTFCAPARKRNRIYRASTGVLYVSFSSLGTDPSYRVHMPVEHVEAYWNALDLQVQTYCALIRRNMHVNASYKKPQFDALNAEEMVREAFTASFSHPQVRAAYQRVLEKNDLSFDRPPLSEKTYHACAEKFSQGFALGVI